MAATILVGVDGSEPSIAALKWAVDEAAHRRCTVRAVSVHMAQGHLVLTNNRTRCIATVTTQSVHAEYTLKLAHIVDSLGTDVTIEQTVLVGRSEDVLTQLSHDAALLVLGAHGDTRLRTGLTLGATTQHCINHAACPIVIIPAAQATASEFTD